ncbi:hypothetical protein ACF1BU_23765 [Streptomyces sp. NPDC014724]|uniref:hypothetical protein n=1 Tax=unclassified Streptomyces TaxID=2593676 RepID=UPI0036F721BC
MRPPALEIDGLGVRLPGEQAARPILDGVTPRGEAVETVGLAPAGRGPRSGTLLPCRGG